MGNKIQFPLNGEIFFKKGTKAFKEGRKKQAIKYLDRAFKITRNSEVNLYYAFVLSVYGKYDKALEIMNEIKKFYLDNEKKTYFYVEMLIENNHFLEAENIIQKHQWKPITKGRNSWKKLREKLNRKRKLYNVRETSKKRELINSLINLSTFNPLLQSKKVKEAEILELSELQKRASNILIDNQIDPIARRAYLELLIQREDKNKYFFLWFDQTKEICPRELSIFDEIQIIDQLKKSLKEKLEKFPDLYYSLETEVMHDLLLLYPFIDKVIKDTDFWIDLYIMNSDFYDFSKKTRPAETKEELEMKKMVERLDIISHRN